MPAGRPGGKPWIRCGQDGHLATSNDGRRIRFWCVNITDWSGGSRQIPSKGDVPMITATLARFGMNSVHLRFLNLKAPYGLLVRGNDTESDWPRWR